jgi:hypothetical protein
MPQPPANPDPEDPAPNLRKLTNLPTAIRIPPTVRSVAGRLTQLNRKVQENPDSIKRRTNSRCVQNSRVVLHQRVKFFMEGSWFRRVKLFFRNSRDLSNQGKNQSRF